MANPFHVNFVMRRRTCFLQRAAHPRQEGFHAGKSHPADSSNVTSHHHEILCTTQSKVCNTAVSDLKGLQVPEQLVQLTFNLVPGRQVFFPRYRRVFFPQPMVVSGHTSFAPSFLGCGLTSPKGAHGYRHPESSMFDVRSLHDARVASNLEAMALVASDRS